ncbi:hypothetical protein [Mycobacterium paraseoulense]|uniref:Uncharacterized protein n=1 Tax=Mycobacterium paraseoulense TaxID=590652 RepID=A0A1X0IAJ4_9MYCO|nr:hypothetical protein [Mycobacterium paraseoulense]MCV7397957.1 hypothetical protein [Mycobacterium paraseoulense]ORB41032.1 hypothetical protein BST39_12525 [Mycobacterium paraseoulense]BBZ70306.1 hypothetical protein MPRS_13990 [Mycobacterium paraseoulense]
MLTFGALEARANQLAQYFRRSGLHEGDAIAVLTENNEHIHAVKWGSGMGSNLHGHLPLAQQLATGLEAHIQSFVDHPFEAVAINRGALSYDAAIQPIISEELRVVGQHLINQLVTEGYLRDPTAIAVEGWLAFVRAASAKWIQSQDISRADLTELCLAAFDCALGYPNTESARPKAATTSGLRGGGLTSFAEPNTTITTGAEHRNRDKRPLIWRRTADDITAKVQRARDALRQIKTQTEH